MPNHEQSPKQSSKRSIDLERALRAYDQEGEDGVKRVLVEIYHEAETKGCRIKIYPRLYPRRTRVLAKNRHENSRRGVETRFPSAVRPLLDGMSACAKLSSLGRLENGGQKAGIGVRAGSS